MRAEIAMVMRVAIQDGRPALPIGAAKGTELRRCVLLFGESAEHRFTEKGWALAEKVPWCLLPEEQLLLVSRIFKTFNELGRLMHDQGPESHEARIGELMAELDALFLESHQAMARFQQTRGSVEHVDDN